MLLQAPPHRPLEHSAGHVHHPRARQDTGCAARSPQGPARSYSAFPPRSGPSPEGMQPAAMASPAAAVEQSTLRVTVQELQHTIAGAVSSQGYSQHEAAIIAEVRAVLTCMLCASL